MKAVRRHIKQIKKNYPNLHVLQLNNEFDWRKKFRKKQFDLIIHWGLLYHLKNWRQDLATSFYVGKLVSLESEVLNSTKDNAKIIHKEYGADQAINQVLS